MRFAPSRKKIAALINAQRAGDSHLEAVAIKAIMTKPYANNKKPDPERFLSRVAFGVSDCWYWTGCINYLGYGARHGTTAHRSSYRLFKGEIPKGMHVLHSCDVRSCVNPEHLRLGTHAENMRDMREKGRCPGRRGEKVATAKLSSKNIIDIRKRRALGQTLTAIAEDYDVTAANISCIVNRQTWKHIK